ncbi:MAG: SIS domain-containing protein [Acidobacteriota bacterium]
MTIDDFPQWIRNAVSSHQDLVGKFFETRLHDLVRVSEHLAGVVRKGGKLMFFGNGGSAADAQHLASELVNRMGRDRRAIAALSLVTDSSVLTSIANDSSYDQVFARQISALGRPGDAAIGISTSGRSENLLEGFREARRLGISTVGILGKQGGPALELVDHPLIVPGDDTQRIQEVHLILGHLLCEMIERIVVPPDAGS